jgi:hypothetical protein
VYSAPFFRPLFRKESNILMPRVTYGPVFRRTQNHPTAHQLITPWGAKDCAFRHLFLLSFKEFSSQHFTDECWWTAGSRHHGLREVTFSEHWELAGGRLEGFIRYEILEKDNMVLFRITIYDEHT